MLGLLQIESISVVGSSQNLNLSFSGCLNEALNQSLLHSVSCLQTERRLRLRTTVFSSPLTPPSNGVEESRHTLPHVQ